MDAIKPVFMLAEWESRDLYKKSFDATYSWSLWDKLKLATTGGKGAGALYEYMAHDVGSFPLDSYRMLFTDNHDKNSWEGNQFSNFGKGLETAMVLCGTANGMPLVYSGQEAGLDRSLEFFEKDEIVWKNHKFYGIYQKLFDLKHKNQALWNGKSGGEMIRVTNNQMSDVLSIYREKNNDAVLSICNFSDKSLPTNVDTKYYYGQYRELFTGKIININSEKTTINLKPWEYLVLVKN